MKELSREVRSQILRNWRDVCDKQKGLEKCLLKIARHPESTMEQLETVRDLYRKSYEEIRKMETMMREIGTKYNCHNSVTRISLTEQWFFTTREV